MTPAFPPLAIAPHCIPPDGGLVLVTGPSRSGKSEWAEALAAAQGGAVTYVATARWDTSDPEWQARLVAHQQRRPAHWATREIPSALAPALAVAPLGETWLVDSLGTWVANGLEVSDQGWQIQVDDLVTSVQRPGATRILVAEETGWGVVPAYAQGRLFRDRLGTLTRRVGAIADRVYLVVAGYALDLKAGGHPVPPAGEHP